MGSTNAFADTSSSESQKNITIQNADEHIIEMDFDSLNLKEAYSETKNYIDEEGNPYTLGLKFTPAIEGRGTSTNAAYAGTWTSSYTSGVINQSYQFDLSKSGSRWVISNAQNHTYSGVFVSFANPSLYISRSTTTSS